MSQHPAALEPQPLLDQCSVRRTRGSGPGGQHRNKVETAIVITHTPSGISGRASERRSQADNQRVALFRLRVNLALELRRPTGAAGLPSARWRLPVNGEHDDFPAVLAEAIDVIDHHGYDVKAAAQRLGCSMSQLVKLLSAEPKALQRVNIQRQQRDLRPLRRN